MHTAQRILLRAGLLEQAAVAASTFSTIQHTRVSLKTSWIRHVKLTTMQDDPVTSINGMLQALRLWNRAFDTLSRLDPSPSFSKSEQNSDNPFLGAPKGATEGTQSAANDERQMTRKLSGKSSALSGIWWRIAEGLLNTLFSLTQAYVARGSPREAEFFSQQAKDLSLALNMPAMTSRALARLGEIYLHLGQLNDSHSCLVEAATLISDTAGPDAAEIHRLNAEYNRMSENNEEAQHLYDEAIAVLDKLEHQFVSVDGHHAGYEVCSYRIHQTDCHSPRRSNGLSPNSSSASLHETLTPTLFLSILRQNGESSV